MHIDGQKHSLGLELVCYTIERVIKAVATIYETLLGNVTTFRGLENTNTQGPLRTRQRERGGGGGGGGWGDREREREGERERERATCRKTSRQTHTGGQKQTDERKTLF